MVIRRQSSLDKIIYEKLGQQLMFGHDNISFKTVNLPKAQRFSNLCKKFKLKKFVIKVSLSLPVIFINN